MSATATATPDQTGKSEPRIAIALGGGSARGLAHVLMLEALDDLGVKPVCIAGTSIGAIIGSCYAAGMSGAEIRAYSEELLAGRMSILKRLGRDFPNSLAALWSLKSAPVVDGVTLLEIMMPDAVRCDFASLKIPFMAVTTDFYAIDQVVIKHGPVIPAVTASSSLPSLMRPVEIEGRVLIDGGFVNPTPYDLLIGKADITLAIDVTGDPRPRPGDALPGAFDVWVGATQILFHSITREKLKNVAPDIFIRPAVGQFGTLDFFKFADIFAAAAAAKEELKHELGAAVERWQAG